MPYLQLVALNEGHVFPQADVARLYDQTRAAPLPLWYGGGKDWPAPPRLVDEAEEGGGDLRRALMKLQVECGWRVGGGEVMEGETQWSKGRLVVRGDERAAVERAVDEGGMEVEGEEDTAVRKLKRMAMGADSVSFADSFVARRQPVALLVSLPDLPLRCFALD